MISVAPGRENLRKRRRHWQGKAKLASHGRKGAGPVAVSQMKRKDNKHTQKKTVASKSRTLSQ